MANTNCLSQDGISIIYWPYAQQLTYQRSALKRSNTLLFWTRNFNKLLINIFMFHFSVQDPIPCNKQFKINYRKKRFSKFTTGLELSIILIITRKNRCTFIKDTSCNKKTCYSFIICFQTPVQALLIMKHSRP